MTFSTKRSKKSPNQKGPVNLRKLAVSPFERPFGKSSRAFGWHLRKVQMHLESIRKAFEEAFGKHLESIREAFGKRPEAFIEKKRRKSFRTTTMIELSNRAKKMEDCTRDPTNGRSRR